jgi:hypothetical protein
MLTFAQPHEDSAMQRGIRAPTQRSELQEIHSKQNKLLYCFKLHVSAYKAIMGFNTRIKSTHIYVYIYICIHIYMYTYIYVHTHTHTHSLNAGQHSKCRKGHRWSTEFRINWGRNWIYLAISTRTSSASCYVPCVFLHRSVIFICTSIAFIKFHKYFHIWQVPLSFSNIW